MANNFCSCDSNKQEPIVLLGSGLMGCMRCNKPIDNEAIDDKAFDAEAGTSTETKASLVGKKINLDQQRAIGNSAAQRTVKYASLFEKVGNILQILNAIGAFILIAAGLFIPVSGWIKFGYWIAILIWWGFSYLQTSLIRGLASYFQMKASDYIIRNWKK